MLYVLVLIMLANPADRMLYSTDGKAPTVFSTLEACTNEGLKHALILKSARVPAKLVCVPAEIRSDGVIIEKPDGSGPV